MTTSHSEPAPATYGCDGCERAAWDSKALRLHCHYYDRPVPRTSIGSHCPAFQRYAGAEQKAASDG